MEIGSDIKYSLQQQKIKKKYNLQKKKSYSIEHAIISTRVIIKAQQNIYYYY